MRTFLLIVILIFAAEWAKPQIGGRYTYLFLDLPFSPTIAALGNYNVSLNDSNVIQTTYNPAVFEQKKQLYFDFSIYFAGIKYGQIFYTPVEKKKYAITTGIQFINYGKFDRADPAGNIIGYFTAAEYSFIISYKFKTDSLFNIGVNIKPVFSYLENYTSFGLAFDAGVLFRKDNFSAGFTLNNFGYQIKPYNSVREKLPFDIRLGATLKLKHAPFRFSVTARHLNKKRLLYYQPESEEVVLYGLEANTPSEFEKNANEVLSRFVFSNEIFFGKNFKLNFGLNYLLRQQLKIKASPGLTGFSAGFDINIKKIGISVSRVKYHLAGTATVVGVKVLL